MSKIICLNSIDADIISRPYGTLHLLTPPSVNLKNVRVQKIYINPSLATSNHFHPMEEIYYVITGIGIVKSESSEYKIKRGSLVIIPSNTIHQVINISPKKPLVYLFIMSPPWDSNKVSYINQNGV